MRRLIYHDEHYIRNNLIIIYHTRMNNFLERVSPQSSWIYMCMLLVLAEKAHVSSERQKAKVASWQCLERR
jgi:hypothetical protein